MPPYIQIFLTSFLLVNKSNTNLVTTNAVKKLTTSPVCLAVGSHGMDIRLERYLIEQKQLATSSKKILEINPKHAVVIALRESLLGESTLDEAGRQSLQIPF